MQPGAPKRGRGRPMGLELHWLRPWWLLAVPALSLLLGIIVLRVRRSSAWESLVDPALRPLVLTRGARSLGWPPLILLGMAWLLLAVALAGPAWQRDVRPVFRIEQPRVLLLDLSESMRARDLKPSRLARARFEVMDLLEETDEGQFGLIAFGAEPFLIAPLTNDAATVREQVPLLNPDILPLLGERRTDLALDFAGKLLRRTGASGADVILVADALGAQERAEDVAATLASAGHRVSVLALVPNASFDALARAGAGVVVPAVADASDARRLLGLQGDADLSGKTEQVSLDRHWRDDGPWLVLFVLPLAALAFRRGWIGLWIGLCPAALLLVPPQPAQASLWGDLWLRPEQQAVRAARAGRLDPALLERLDAGWRAALRHAAGDYQGALDELAGQTGARAHYNRGNVLARLGRFDESLAEYDAALDLEPAHADARHNRELLLELMRSPSRPPTLRTGEAGADSVPDRRGGDDSNAEAPASLQPSTERRGPGPSADGTGQDAAKADGGQQDVGGGDRSARADADAGEATSAGAELASDQSAVATASERPSSDTDGGGPVAAAVDAASSPDEDAQVDDVDAYLLRQVPDEPGRLLRERLLLQYLRRHGQLY